MTAKPSKLAHFQNLVAIASVDGEIHEKELELLNKKAAELQLTKDQIDFTLKNINYIIFAPPYSHENKVEFLKDVIDVVFADGVVHVKEVERCKKLCVEMELSLEFLDSEMSERSLINPLRSKR